MCIFIVAVWFGLRTAEKRQRDNENKQCIRCSLNRNKRRRRRRRRLRMGGCVAEMTTLTTLTTLRRRARARARATVINWHWVWSGCVDAAQLNYGFSVCSHGTHIPTAASGIGRTLSDRTKKQHGHRASATGHTYLHTFSISDSVNGVFLSKLAIRNSGARYSTLPVTVAHRDGSAAALLVGALLLTMGCSWKTTRPRALICSDAGVTSGTTRRVEWLSVCVCVRD